MINIFGRQAVHGPGFAGWFKFAEAEAKLFTANCMAYLRESRPFLYFHELQTTGFTRKLSDDLKVHSQEVRQRSGQFVRKLSNDLKDKLADDLKKCGDVKLEIDSDGHSGVSSPLD